jgi:hypothetical protein
VRFVVDAQLPPALARLLARFVESITRGETIVVISEP